MKAWLPLFGLVIILIGCSESVLHPYQVQRPDGSSSEETAEAQDVVATDEAAADNARKPDDAAGDPSDNSTRAPPTGNTPPANPVPATGSVAVNVNIIPPTPAGPYRNRGHIRSLWITDANNTYIKTIHAFAGQRSVHLKRWQVFTNQTLDATTGATQVTPAAGIPVTATWDLKNKAGAPMLTGNYKLWLEFTESNTPALDAGKTPADPAQVIDGTNGYEFLVVPFSVSPTGTMKTDSSNAVFKDVAVKHVP